MHLIMVEKNARQYLGALAGIFVWVSSAHMERPTVWTKQEQDEDALKERYRG
jgi:hypothetical protein